MRFAEFYWFNERLDCILVVAKLAASGPFGAICSCYWLSSPFAQTSRQHNTRHLKSEKYGTQNKDKGSAIKVKVKVVAYFLLNLGFAGIIACRRRRRGVEKVKEELRRES